MSLSEQQRQQHRNETKSDESLKLAVAMALLRSKLLHNRSSSSSSEVDAQRWKRKAKERKQEILRLQQDLKETEDGLHCDLFPQSASCKCYFFDKLGSSRQLGDCSDWPFNDVLRRRFLRQVRLKERRRIRRKGNSTQQFASAAILNYEDEMEQLKTSIDFLVELCEADSVVELANFANWSHQAVDFILDSLRNLLSTGKNMEKVEEIVSSLIVRLIRRLCTPIQGDELHQPNADSQYYVQHLIRKLGKEQYVGQRAGLLVSQRISAAAESMLFMDPFDDIFPEIHSCLFLMIQLIDFLVSDYLLHWAKDEGFDSVLFEDWITSLLHARKTLELLESRNGLYMLYMDRVMGELTKQVIQTSSLQKLKGDVLNKLFS